MDKFETKEEYEKYREDTESRKYMEEKHQRAKRVAMK